MITDNKITEIFCLADDFCKYFSSELKNHQIGDGKVHRNKPGRLSDAEVITILILFHSKGFRCLKHFYTQYVCKHLTHLFPRTVSYNRFVELQKSVQLSLTIFVKEVLMGTCTGIAYVDSTPLRVCKHPRILIHKTFKGIAERGKCSMGWFFGFKLHLIINDRGRYSTSCLPRAMSMTASLSTRSHLLKTSRVNFAATRDISANNCLSFFL